MIVYSFDLTNSFNAFKNPSGLRYLSPSNGANSNTSLIDIQGLFIKIYSSAASLVENLLYQVSYADNLPI